MQSLLFVRAVVALFCTTMISSPTLSQETASYFLHQTFEYPKDCSDVQRQCSTSNSSGVYLIRPEGFQEPFEVFCDNDASPGGWTVIQRRDNGFVNFNRNWLEYRNGFGFLSTEFWLGNRKLAYLTNQAAYELLIEIELLNGSFFHTTHRGFRIADEFGQYELQHLGNFGSNGSSVISECPRNSYFLDDCTQICTCSDIHHVCNAVSCDTNAACIEIDNGFRNCSCNDGYEGDGLTCTSATLYADCKEVYDAGSTESGVYTILPEGWTNPPFNVFCDMINGEGWTVFQRRKNDTTTFYRNWAEYKEGFGDLSGNVWLGNEKLYYLTNQGNYKLRFDIITSDGTPYHAEFTEFQIESEDNNYRLNKLGSRSTTSGGYVGHYFSRSIGKYFSTYDRDNDACGNYNCAEKHRSGWWHFDHFCSYCYTRIDGAYCVWFSSTAVCNYGHCTNDNFNGEYTGNMGGSYGHNIYCNPQFVEMKIRPSS